MNYLKNLKKMNKFDKSTLHALINAMFEDNTDRAELLYWSLEKDTYPTTAKKKKIIIKIVDADDNQ